MFQSSWTNLIKAPFPRPHYNAKSLVMVAQNVQTKRAWVMFCKMPAPTQLKAGSPTS